MKCVEVAKKGLGIRILESRSRPRKGMIPLQSSYARDIIRTSPIGRIVYFDVLYPSMEAADRRAGRNRKACLITPDPWLVVLAAVMWEGIVQGLTWDCVKAAGKAALARLAERGLAPTASKARRTTSGQRESRTEVGFHWVEYAESGKKQRELFLGLRRVAKQKGAIH
jgi:hypothetical protein